MKATIVKKPKKPVELFTDDIHQDMFIFQPALSSRGWGGNKPVVKALVFKTGKK